MEELRRKVFLSHATPEDNEFVQWLSLKLIALGYDVWCDILYLDKGVDFWRRIEKEIRENTCKFLLVSSRHSNQREGVLKELAVANKVKKQLGDETFIIPLAIDEGLSYDDINIEIVRLNAIDFLSSWAMGLRALIEALEKQCVPKNEPDFTKANDLYGQLVLQDKGVVEREEVFDSNWFPIEVFPEELRFHNFGDRIPRGFNLDRLPYPAVIFGNHLCTFACEYDFVDELPKTQVYSGHQTRRIPLADILKGRLLGDFIDVITAQRLVVRLLNRAFESYMRGMQFREYLMGRRTGYWAEKGRFEKNKVNKILLVGVQKSKYWHYGISVSARLYPFPAISVSSHIFFTEDGIKPIDSISIQHSSRRKQGKNWWNNDWRTKLIAFMKAVSDQEPVLSLPVGGKEMVRIRTSSVQFRATAGYLDPDAEASGEDDFEERIAEEYYEQWEGE